MARTPKRAAILWGSIGLAVGLVITLVLAMAARRPGEPSDAMFERGQAAAPVALLAAAVPAVIADFVTKKRQ